MLRQSFYIQGGISNGVHIIGICCYFGYARSGGQSVREGGLTMISLLTGATVGSAVASFGEGAMLAASVYLALKGVSGRRK